MVRRMLVASVACSLGGMWFGGGSALAAVTHTVLPGESLWSISAANNLTTRTVAVYNGLPEDAGLIAGQTIQVPTVEEGAAALAGAGVPVTTTTAPATTTTTAVPAPGMSPVPSPYGDLYLTPAAAQAWNAMRAEALSVYGIDLYPGGPASAYRTFAQQAELYQAFLAGYGAPANPPGSSSHELGTAVDLPTPEMRSVIDQIGWKYGWGKAHAPGEWWHVDYLGG
jgi:LAS superfamily LD-carboxypeptidase LdcB